MNVGIGIPVMPFDNTPDFDNLRTETGVGLVIEGTVNELLKTE
jgi:hypothetical protein